MVRVNLQVRRATHAASGRTVAVKFLSKARLQELQQDAGKTLSELRNHLLLQHPNIVQLLDILDSPGYDFCWWKKMNDQNS